MINFAYIKQLQLWSYLFELHSDYLSLFNFNKTKANDQT